MQVLQYAPKKQVLQYDPKKQVYQSKMLLKAAHECVSACTSKKPRTPVKEAAELGNGDVWRQPAAAAGLVEVDAPVRVAHLDADRENLWVLKHLLCEADGGAN